MGTRSARSVWSRWSAVAVVVALTAACSSGGDSSAGEGSTTSVETGSGDFCATWWDSARDLREQWSVPANDDPVASLLLLIAAPNELARHFERVSGVAPEEIRGDLDALAEHFDRALDGVGTAIKDPLAFLVDGTVQAAGLSGSFERVDEYVSDQCPVPSDLAQAASARTSEACAAVTATDVSGDSDLNALLEFLADVDAASSRAAASARRLRSAALELDPPARFGFEALGRLRFEGVDVDATFTQMVRAAAEDCAVYQEANGLTGGGTDSAIERLLEAIGPRPGYQVTDTLFGRCGGGFQLVPPHHAAYACGRTVERIDLTTGEVTVFDSAMPGRSDDEHHQLLGDGRGVWARSVVEHPATGLEPPTWSASVTYLDLTTGDELTLPLVDHRPGSSPLTPNGPELTVVYADETRVMAVDRPSRDAPDRTLTVWDWSGAVLGEHRTTEPFSSEIVTDGPFVSIGSSGGLFDTRTAQPVLATVDRLDIVRTPCPGYDFAIDDRTRDVYALIPGKPGSAQQVGTIEHGAQGYLRDGYLFRDTEGFHLLGFDGTTRWSLSDAVVVDALVVFEWVVVQNHSDEVIVVDPATGAEAAIDAALERELKTLYEARRGSVNDTSFQDVAVIDPVTGTVVLGSSGQYRKIDLADLCG